MTLMLFEMLKTNIQKCLKVIYMSTYILKKIITAYYVVQNICLPN